MKLKLTFTCHAHVTPAVSHYNCDLQLPLAHTCFPHSRAMHLSPRSTTTGGTWGSHASRRVPLDTPLVMSPAVQRLKVQRFAVHGSAGQLGKRLRDPLRTQQPGIRAMRCRWHATWGPKVCLDLPPHGPAGKCILAKSMHPMPQYPIPTHRGPGLHKAYAHAPSPTTAHLHVQVDKPQNKSGVVGLGLFQTTGHLCSTMVSSEPS